MSLPRGYRIAIIAFLVVVGVVPAASRSVDAIGRLVHPDSTRPDMAGSDRFFTSQFVRMSGAPPGSDEARALGDDFGRFLGKFGRHPWATLAHVLPGVLLFLLAPL